MMPLKSKGDETLETMLNLATSPQNPTENQELINDFCNQVNNELEGPQIAVKLLAHKIQSPQEKEAIFAISVLENCVRQCDIRFHREIGKFRFLNEIIKVISPKYLGHTTTDVVKRKCIEFLYCCSKGLTSEPKITEAYNMLKRQGIVKQDPTYADAKIYIPPNAPVQKASIFDNNEKSKELSRLLKSRNPEDLKAANKLIKNIVQEDNERVEKLSRRMTDMETVRNNAKLLNEMLQHYVPNETQTADLEIMKELIDTLGKARQNLFSYARECDDKEVDNINDIIHLCDQVNDTIKRYHEIVDEPALSSLKPPPPQSQLLALGSDAFVASGSRSAPSNNQTNFDLLSSEQNLIESGGGLAPNQSQRNGRDLLSNDLDLLNLSSDPPPYVPLSSPTVTSANQPNSSTPANSGVSHSDLLSDIFSSPSISAPLSSGGILNSGQTSMAGMTTTPQPISSSALPSVSSFRLTAASSQLSSKSSPNSSINKSTPSDKAFLDLDILGKQMIDQSKKKKHEKMDEKKADLLDIFDVPPVTNLVHSQDDDNLLDSTPIVTGKASPVISTSNIDLSVIDISMSNIKPHPSLSPRVIVEDLNQLKIVVHFTKDQPMANVYPFVIVVTSCNPSPVMNINFVVKSSESIPVFQKSPSGSELPAFSPFLPPSSLSQILLVHTTNESAISLKYTFSYEINGIKVSSEGEIVDISLK